MIEPFNNAHCLLSPAHVLVPAAHFYLFLLGVHGNKWL